MKSKSLSLCYDRELNPMDECPDQWGEFGVFTTLRVSISSERLVFFLEQHMDRLMDSLELLEIQPFCSAGLIEEALYCFINALETGKDYLLRVSMTPESLSFHARLAASSSDRLIGVPVLLERHNPHIKSLDYLSVLECIKKCGLGSEALLMNASGDLLEGATSNLIVCRGEEILIPNKACLPGITQSLLREALLKEGFSVRDASINRNELTEVSEILLCGTGKEVSSLSQIPEYAWRRKSLNVFKRVSEIYTDLKKAYIAASF